jgi:hypothetical protein
MMFNTNPRWGMAKTITGCTHPFTAMAVAQILSGQHPLRRLALNKPLSGEFITTGISRTCGL